MSLICQLTSEDIKHHFTTDVEVLLYVHRNRRFIRDGETRTATSTFTQFLSSVAVLSSPSLIIVCPVSVVVG